MGLFIIDVQIEREGWVLDIRTLALRIKNDLDMRAFKNAKKIWTTFMEDPVPYPS